MLGAGLALSSTLFVPLREPCTDSAAFFPASTAALQAPTLPSTLTVHIPPPFAYSKPSSLTFADFTACVCRCHTGSQPKGFNKTNTLVSHLYTSLLFRLNSDKSYRLIQASERHLLYESRRVGTDVPELICLIKLDSKKKGPLYLAFRTEELRLLC